MAQMLAGTGSVAVTSINMVPPDRGLRACTGEGALWRGPCPTLEHQGRLSG